MEGGEIHVTKGHTPWSLQDVAKELPGEILGIEEIDLLTGEE